MGILSKKSKTSTEPPKWAKPYIQQGLAQTNNVFQTQQPKLDAMGDTASKAFEAIAPGAFGNNPFIQNAQQSASAISSGSFLNTNPGQSTYGKMQGRNRDPSMGLLNDAANASPGAAALAAGGINPATGLATGVAGGKYLNAQPSSSTYANMMSDDYSKANPFLDDMIRQTTDNVTKDTNRLFAARGMGSGVSSAFADVLSKNTADSGNALRYQNYNDAENRRLQAAGQSDAAWSGERGRMDASTGLLSSDYNAAQGRALNAAQSDAQTRLAAAQALGGQYTQGQDRALEAAKAGDAAQTNQVDQMLKALGLTPGLRQADYAGVDPALGVLNSAATIPWTGVTAYNGGVNGLTNGYGTSSKNPGMFDWMSMFSNNAKSAAAGGG